MIKDLLDLLRLEYFTNLDAKGAKRRVKMWSTKYKLV